LGQQNRVLDIAQCMKIVLLQVFFG
jgi:hypothetical protein